MPKTHWIALGGFITVLALSNPVLAQDLDALRAGVVRIIAHPSHSTTRTGTGFIVKATPDVVYIVTAAHVVEGDVQPEVEFFTKRDVPVRAAVKGAERGDDQRGLALLTVAGKDNIPAGLVVLPLASDDLMISSTEDIAVIGLPREARDWAILYGRFVSRTGRDVTLDINIDEGASGAPVLKGTAVIGLVQGLGKSYVRGNPVESVRSYLKGFGVELPDTSTVSAGATTQQPTTSSSTGMPTSTLPATKTGQDEAPMVLIPEGKFWMGSREGEGDEDERPRHEVELDAYYIDTHEVTTARYAQFMKATNRNAPAYWDQVNLSRDGNKPVVGISWNDAKAYCEWAGKRLPTEAEWEKAARGTESRKYPWGNEEPTSERANYGQSFTSEIVYRERLKPVGSFEDGKTLKGVYDMAGNVWEWVADWYAKDYYSRSPTNNPKGPESGKYRALRGGSWGDTPWYLRSASRGRDTPTGRVALVGVRGAVDAR